MLALTLASVLALASPADTEPSAPRTIEAALIRGDGIDLGEVERALRVRLPSLELVEQGRDMPSGAGLRAFVEIRRVSPGQVEVRVILSDGRAYLRTVDTEGEPPARPVAGALALLIPAIEDDSVAPDERDVPVPPAIAGPAEPPSVPEVREVTCPPVKPCPQPVAPAVPPPPALELAPLVRAGGTFGLAPPGLRGGLFGVGLDLRWRQGAIVTVDLQTIAARVDSSALTRVRGAVGAGFGLRRGAFEMPIVGLVGVEGWGVRGGDVEAVRREPAGPTRPLIGGGLRLSPGVRAHVGPVALRAGARVELWGSGEPGPGGLRFPLLVRTGGEPLAAVGGAELSLALELSVWLAPRRGRAKKP